MDRRIEIMERYLELIYDLGYDYDGCNDVESLKGLINEMCRLASLGRACNVTEPITEDGKGKKYNILGEIKMNKMRLVSAYKDYGNPDMWDSSSNVKCVCDEQIYANKREGKQVMLLIEPRPIQPNVYEYALQVANQYEYVFTHDSKLLNALPNAKPILWGGVWCRSENPKKTKLISMICSDKELCDLHKERKRIAKKYKDKIDVYGTIDGGEYVNAIDSLENYMYSVVIENHIDDLWFTEKICNCFATKTIPIYYGARDIGKYFNEWGIIRCFSINELEETIDRLINNEKKAVAYYRMHESPINQNYELSKQYEKFDEWLYKTYEKEIGELFEN